MLLTIDAGNTRTKWAIFNHDGNIVQHGACMNDALQASDFNPRTLGHERVIISNVAGADHAARLESLLSGHGLPVTWVKSSHRSCNVSNSYLQAETLGTDRWAALIAAWHIKQAPCVVVNAGTAVTIDALCRHAQDRQQGEFLGGMILPGVALMRASLGQNTAQLPEYGSASQTGSAVAMGVFATSTAQAINSGILCAISGAITQMAAAVQTKCGQIPYIILSGGDAPVIQSCLADTMTNPGIIIEPLVLTGLYLLDRSRQ